MGKKNVSVGVIMLIELLALGAGCLLIASFSCQGNLLEGLTWFFDMPSLLLLLIFAVPVMCVCGSWKDFIRVFSLHKKGAHFTMSELKKILLAVELLQKLVMYAGLLVVIESMVIVLTNITSPEVLGPNLAVGLLVILYVAIIEILLLPLNVVTQKKIADYMEEGRSLEEQH